MRKVILLIGLIVLSSIIAKSQTTVITDDSTYTPTSANAIFEVFSQNNDKGILIPRLTTVQRTTIATSGAVDQSLMVFDTDTKTFWYFDGTAWVEMATGGTVSDNQNIDSLTLNGLTLTTYIENGNSAFVDLTAVSDSAISYIINNSDTLFSNSAFTDSIVSIINNNIDTLFLNQTFIDSLASVIYNQGDTLLYNQTFISALQDSIDTDIDNAYLTSNTLNIEENGNTISVDLTALVNDADSDPTNEIELPATAVNGQVLTWDGTDWIAQNPGSGADNWGTQVVVSDGTLDGDGTSTNPLTVNSTATDNQNISGSGLAGTTLTIGIENGSNETVDLSSLQDGTGTDDQNLTGATLTGTSLQIDIENGSSTTVDLAGLQDGTGTDDQNLTGATLTGTNLQINIENGSSTTVDLAGLQDGTGTDNQTLSFSGTSLTIEDGNTVNLAALQGTDDQNISGSGLLGTTLTIGIENGTNETVDLSSLQDGTGTDDQNISGSGLSGTILTIGIENGTNETVNLASLQDGTGTDDQTLSFNSSSNILSIEDGNTVDLSSLDGGSAGWSLTGNGTVATDFIGTTNNNALNFKVANEKSGSLAVDNTIFGYKAGSNVTGTSNAIYGDEAGYNTTTATENVFVGHRVGYDMLSGNSNTAIGYNAFYNYGGAGGTHAGGSGNVAVGKYAMFNPTSGDYNVAVGYSTYSLVNTGSKNVFIGYAADANGDHAASEVVAIGVSATVGASNVVTIGSHSSADGLNSTAIGYRAHADQPNTIILGQIDGVNGSTNDTKVGIGTSSPRAILNTNGGIGIGDSGNGLSIADGNENTIQINTDTHYGGTYDNHTGYLMYSIMPGGFGTAELHFCTSNGWGTYETSTPALVVKQNSIVVNGTTYSSDRRIKTEITNINYGLNTLMQLKPVKYNKHTIKGDFNNGNFRLGDSFAEVGFIAQDVYEIIPEIVSKPNDETKELWGIDYAKLTPVLVKAIQELEQKNNDQQKIIDKLIKQNEEILNHLKNSK